MKQCVSCKIKKNLSEFSKNIKSKDGHQNSCKSCNQKERKKWYKINKDKTKEYYESNKDRIKEYQKSYKSLSSVKERTKEYQQKYHKDYRKKRRKKDPLFKLKDNLRSRTAAAFRNKGYSKDTKTMEMLGIEWNVVKMHMERQFKEGMSWDNHGEWHIDHIIPLASANTPERIKQLCHYSNLQPLWASDNIIKKDKINGQQTKMRI